MITTENKKGATESLYPHMTDDLCILMVKGKKIPYYLYLFLIFKKEVWGILLGTIAFGTIIWKIIGNSSTQSWLMKFLTILRILSGNSLPNLPQIASERIFITFWLLYTLILVTAFMSKLTTALMEEKYYPSLDTLDKIQEAGLSVYGFGSVLKDIMKAFNGTSRMGLAKKLRTYDDRYDLAEYAKNNITELLYEFCTVTPCMVNHERILRIIKFPGIGRHLFILKESLLPNYLSFQVPKGSPLLDEFNSYLRKVIEAGLMLFWRDSVIHTQMTNGFLHPDDLFYETSKFSQIRALSLIHLQAAFMILFSGLLLSFLVFLMEIFIQRNKEREFLTYSIS